MRDDREQFYIAVKEKLYDIMGPTAISDVMDAISLSMKGFMLQKNCTDIVIYEWDNEKIINRFVVSKAVEGLAETSLKTYTGILREFFLKSNKNVKDVVTDDIRIFLAQKKITNKSGNYLNLIRRTLNSFYGWCVENEVVEKNPAAKINSIRVEKKLRKAFSEDEMEMLRMQATSLRNKAIIEFLYSTGCRVSEMCGLNRNDVDMASGKAYVLGKGKKYREVYLSSRCKSILTEYLKKRTDDTEYLFESSPMPFSQDQRIHRFTTAGVETMLRNLGKKVGIEDVHPHRFRRTAATLALKRGMPIEQVQKMLGHEDIATTTIYAQSNTDDIQVAHSKYVV